MRRMMWSGVAVLLVGASVGSRAVSSEAAGRTCADLATLAIPNVAITSTQDVPAGPFTPPGGTRSVTVPAFCRLAAVATPTTDSRIGLEVWVPAGNDWNGKLLGTANGGYSGAIAYAAMAAGLARGYATVGTDTGHAGDQVDFGRGHPEKIADWREAVSKGGAPTC